MASSSGSLWRHADFLKLWSGQILSLTGSQVSTLAIPFIATTLLAATPFQMGLLGAVQQAPWFIFGLLAGAWIDRRRRRPVMIVADLARAVCLGAIPVLAVLGILGFWHLYAVSFLAGTFTVFFNVAYQAYLPSVIKREQLVEGNSKLELSSSVADIAGPGLAGTLVQILTAPFAIMIDAVSYLISALLLAFIRFPEPPPPPASVRRGILAEAAEGISVVARNPILRATIGCVATLNFAVSLEVATFMLFLTRELQLPPVLLGLVFGAGALGFLPGVAVVDPLIKRFGIGRILVGAVILAGVSGLLQPLAGGPVLVASAVLVVGGFFNAFAAAIGRIGTLSLRQAVTPLHLQGRVTATSRVLATGLPLFAALLGGVLGEVIGLRPTLVCAALGQLFAVIWIVASPVRTLRETPAAADA